MFRFSARIALSCKKMQSIFCTENPKGFSCIYFLHGTQAEEADKSDD